MQAIGVPTAVADVDTHGEDLYGEAETASWLLHVATVVPTGRFDVEVSVRNPLDRAYPELIAGHIVSLGAPRTLLLSMRAPLAPGAVTALFAFARVGSRANAARSSNADSSAHRCPRNSLYPLFDGRMSALSLA